MRTSAAVLLALPLLACDGGASGTVAVRDRLGQPVADAEVRVHGPHGALIAAETTGPDGDLALPLPAGGAVTVADADRTLFRSVIGLVEDRDLEVELPVARQGVVVTVRTPSTPAGTRFFWLDARCAGGLGGGSEAHVEIRPCATPTTTVLLTAYGDGETPLGYLVARDVNLQAQDLELAGAWQPPAGTTRFDVVDPAGARWADVYRADLDGGYLVSGERVTLPEDRRAMTYAGVGDRALYRFGTDDSRYTFVTSADRTAIAIGAADVLPRPVNVNLAGRAIVWAGGGGADFVEASVSVGATSGDVILGEQRWTVTVPGDRAHATFPDHPDFRWPDGGAGQIVSLHVKSVESPAWTDYADVLARSGLTTDDGVPVPVPADFSMRVAFGLSR